jgi:hypothetical protein
MSGMAAPFCRSCGMGYDKVSYPRIIGAIDAESTGIPADFPKSQCSRRAVRDNVLDMDDERQIPSKMKARRVRVHVTTTLAYIQRIRLPRDAARCRSIDEISWRSLDLYTIALDLCEDDGTRELVAQARGTIIRRLM